MELLQQPKFHHFGTEIRNLVSCPSNIFRHLYHGTLCRLAEYCQAMPFTADDFNTIHGFLLRQLKLATAMLKLRRGILFLKMLERNKYQRKKLNGPMPFFRNPVKRFASVTI